MSTERGSVTDDGVAYRQRIQMHWGWIDGILITWQSWKYKDLKHQ